MKGFTASLMVIGLLGAIGLRPGVAEEKGSARKARERMVRRHIIERGIRDERVIAAMLKVPRHEFVPPKYRHLAYEDIALPIGSKQTISPPYVVALMTELLRLKPTDKVLEVGTGSGYHAAILSRIAKVVYTVEIIKPLAERAKETLKRLGYRNVFVKVGDGYFGWEEHAPYDAIIVTCAPDHVPPPLIEQLKEGGRMVVPVGTRHRQKLYLLEKRDGKLVRKAIVPVLFVPMIREKRG